MLRYASTIGQLVHPQTSACTYVVSCSRSGAAALIDPLPPQASEIREHVRSHGLHLEWVLRTRRPVEDVGPERRFAALLAEVGLTVPTEQRAPSPWEGLPTLTPRFEADQEHALVAVCDAVVGLQHGVARVGPRLDVARGFVPATPTICASLHLAVGSVDLRVVAVPGGGLAYLFGDRLVSGRELAAHPEGETLPDALLSELPPDTVIYPSHLCGVSGVSTVAQELRTAAARQRRMTLEG